MKKIQTGDSVVVIAGKQKGAKSTVVSQSGERVILKGVNLVKKAVKGEGYKEKELPVHVSNIAHWDSKAGSASKVGIREDKSGKKERFYKKSGNTVK